MVRRCGGDCAFPTLVTHDPLRKCACRSRCDAQTMGEVASIVERFAVVVSGANMLELQCVTQQAAQLCIRDLYGL
jgi:hypothetical protein